MSLHSISVVLFLFYTAGVIILVKTTLIIFVVLIVAWKVLSATPPPGGTAITAQHWAVIWGNLRLLWILLLLYEIYRVVHLIRTR